TVEGFGFLFQFPTAAHDHGIRSHAIEDHLAESEMAHLPAFFLIALPVALICLLPTLGFRVAGIEAEFRRIPVAFHDALQITLVPCLFLVIKQFVDGLARRLVERGSHAGGWRFLRGRQGRIGNDHVVASEEPANGRKRMAVAVWPLVYDSLHSEENRS